MVKFPSASIFLTFASIFAFVSAVPAASPYSIASIIGSRPVFSDGTEHDGDRVLTVAYSEENVANSKVLTIKPSLAPSGASFSTVQGKAGLYISAVDFPGNSSLFWRKTPFTWGFSLQPTYGDYTIFIPDKDGYWCNDPSGTGQLAVLPGSEIAMQNEMSFGIGQ
ncbi:hypothetical protein F5887DRAFT_957616 [Amanita rubescens]|nr:hypothetical protein F5887DRAFT_957616 [Amanita rubescens]